MGTHTFLTSTMAKTSPCHSCITSTEKSTTQLHPQPRAGALTLVFSERTRRPSISSKRSTLVKSKETCQMPPSLKRPATKEDTSFHIPVMNAQEPPKRPPFNTRFSMMKIPTPKSSMPTGTNQLLCLSSEHQMIQDLSE